MDKRLIISFIRDYKKLKIWLGKGSNVGFSKIRSVGGGDFAPRV